MAGTYKDDDLLNEMPGKLRFKDPRADIRWGHAPCSIRLKFDAHLIVEFDEDNGFFRKGDYLAALTDKSAEWLRDRLAGAGIRFLKNRHRETHS